MEFGIGSVISSLALIFVISKVYSFIRNYIAALRTGYPIIATPVLSKSVPWMILGPTLQPQFKKWLPKWIYKRMDIVTHGWEFRWKNEIHQKLGKVFVVVSPDEVAMWAADPDIGNVILQRRKEYQQAAVTKKIIGLLGSNVLVANGDDWQRQRRILAPIFNERISDSVWKESCRQAQSMLDYLEKHPGGNTLEGLHNIAINIIGHSGYGQTRNWTPIPYKDATNLSKGEMSYFNAIGLITIMLLEAALLPPKFMKLPFMPVALRTLGQAMEDLPRISKDLLDSERQAAKQGAGPRNNLLSMLVQLSDRGKTGGNSGLSLTEDEIRGNLFTFSAAGFDTTANTMGYAVLSLAAYPQWQDWIREDLQKLDTDNSDWDYAETFPKCQRILAVMFETLRNFTPVSHAIRSVVEPQQLTDVKGTHILTPPMDIFVCAQSMHSNPDIWGSDVSEFKPSRWIDDLGKLITPAKGTFLPWSGGPRVCPGMRMAQVEFVATFSTLFHSARCEPLRTEQETDKEARERLVQIMDDSVSKLTLQVRDPAAVKLKWTRI